MITPAEAHPPRFWLTLLRFVALLVGIQAARAGIEWALWRIVRPAGDEVLWNAISSTALLLVGGALLLGRRPSAGDLGIGWREIPMRVRVAYAAGIALLLVLLVPTFFWGLESLALNVYAVLIVPAFEELLFRGYGWQRIAATMSGPRAAIVPWLLTTVLFGLWHLGYADHLLRIQLYHWGAPDTGVILSWKVVIGLVIGLAGGLLRWRTGNAVVPFLFHALWNLFGR